MGSRETASEERRFLLLALIAGLAIRLAWLHAVHGSITGFVGAGEATRAALALVRTGSFADAFYQGYGPTAHLLPVNPTIAAALMWLFGIDTPAANLALLAWSLVQVFGAILLLRCVFVRLGADPLTVRWGTALLLLVTPFVSQEVVDFRYWEGAMAVCLMCLNLLLLLRVAERGGITARTILIVAILGAATFFVSPPVGIAAYACWGIYALRRLTLARIAMLAAASGTALAVLLAPWALRNAEALGTPVLLRSNFGLEFALANHPAALSDAPREQVFADRLLEIHPYHSPAARAALREAGGEVPYARALGARTWSWIADNPTGFARLWLRHLGEFFFPRSWQMYFTGWEDMRDARAITISLIHLLGLAGLAFGIWRRRAGYGMLALTVGLVALPYALVQPVPRYSWLVHGVLAFLAVEAVLGMLHHLRGQRAKLSR
ncbi:hypothetical protein [Sphingomonas sp. LM7]|uniref:hypothetical protein n=1 Tax=Sphingomonas sp. LM7 TaxID=1938607 RepID=UPI000983AF47|nr:hypothetical protein [Sphingomonas sp. LM7]AQR72502.1 hypothetical protein BXU08_01410 [Sphingomonas sp. LM7]